MKGIDVMRTYWELEANILNGDNVVLASGTKAQCKRAFNKMTEEQKSKYFFINLQPYDEEQRLDDDERLYFNKSLLKG
jgi:hypothetical protein